MSWQDWFYVPTKDELIQLENRVETISIGQEAIMATTQNIISDLKTLKEAVEKLAAAKIESEQQQQEMRTIIEETTKIANDAAADDASQGGSTGGGSGATG